VITGSEQGVSIRKKMIFYASEKVVAGVGLVRDRGRPPALPARQVEKEPSVPYIN
jgi:hypothetical protein